MLTFIVRRIIASFFIVIGASFIAYMLVSYAGDPLANASGIQNRRPRAQTIAHITQTLHLNVNSGVPVLHLAQGRARLFRRQLRLRPDHQRGRRSRPSSATPS